MNHAGFDQAAQDGNCFFKGKIMWEKIADLKGETPKRSIWKGSWGDYKPFPEGLCCLSKVEFSLYFKPPGVKSLRGNLVITVPPGAGIYITFMDYLFSLGVPSNPAATVRLRTWPVAATGNTTWHSGIRQFASIERHQGRIKIAVNNIIVVNVKDPLPENKIFDFHLILPNKTVIHDFLLESKIKTNFQNWHKRKKYSLYSCFDFNDDLGKAPWTEKTFNSAMDVYKRLNVKRIYWVYHYGYKSGWWDRPGREYATFRRNTAATYAVCGDFLPAIVRAAHHAGLELHAVFKPFEASIFRFFSPENTFNALKYGKIPRLGGPLLQAPDFVVKNSQFRMERNMEDVPLDMDKRRIGSIVLRSEKGVGAGFDPHRIQLWTSNDNKRYVLRRNPLKLRVENESANEGKRIILDDLNIRAKYMALTVNGGATCIFGNILRHLVEVRDVKGVALPTTFASPCKNRDFRKFGMLADVPEGSSGAGGALDNYHWLDGVFPLGIMMGRERYLQGALCPDYAETQLWWREQVEKLIEIGVDGIDFRIANHNLTFDWEAFGFNRPTAIAFQKRFGVDIPNESFNRIEWRKLRGEAYTGFLRWASQRLRKEGKLVQHHVSQRMRSPEWHTEMEIYFDWPTWMREGLLDEITIKMGDLMGSQANVVSEARRAGLKINYSPYLNGISCHQNGMQIVQNTALSAVASEVDGVIMYENDAFMRVNENGRMDIAVPWLTETFSRYAR